MDSVVDGAVDISPEVGIADVLDDDSIVDGLVAQERMRMN